LIEAHQNRSTENGRSQQFYHFTADQLRRVRLTLTRHQYECSLPQDDAILSGQLTIWEPLYQAIVGEFTNTSDAGIFSGDRNTRQGTQHYSAMALTIRAFLPFACRYIPALDIAIFSLLTMYYGRLHANAGLVSLARSSYIAALSQFRQDLPKARAGPTGTPHIHQALCCTSIALCCFEHLEEVTTSGFGYAAHLNGALRLLQSCGSAMVRDLPGFRLLLKGFRMIALHNSIQRRQSTFLSDQEWNLGIFDKDDSTMQDSLITLAFEVPGLLESVDHLQASMDSSPAPSRNAIVLLEKIHSLRSRLQSWLQELESSVEGDLFWPLNQPEVDGVQFVDPECKPEHRGSLQQLTFASGTIAGLLTHYWCSELSLYTAETVVHRHLQAGELGGSDRGTSSRADKTAQHILEAQAYLTSCLEGTLSMQLVVGTVERYFA
jgi:hypothetical protein